MSSSQPPAPVRPPERVEVEVYSRAVNAWVIRTPGRQYPAAVIQGASLGQLCALAERALERARAAGGRLDEEALDELEELRDLLSGRLRNYEDALRGHRFGAP